MRDMNEDFRDSSRRGTVIAPKWAKWAQFVEWDDGTVARVGGQIL
jgi:hypothetical protein